MNKWEVKKIGEIASIKGGKRVPKSEKLTRTITPYPYIRVTDFNDNGSIDLDDIQYVSDKVFEQIKNYTISKEDVYISIAGTIGKAGIVPSSLDGANLTENACKLVLNEDIYNKYVFYFTQTNSFKVQAGLQTRKMAMPKLALSRLSEIEIPIVSFKAQKQIVSLLDEVFALVDKAKKNIEINIIYTDNLFQSKLNKVFNCPDVRWKMKSWKDILEIRSGRNQKVVESNNGTYPILGSAGKVMAYANDYICEKNTVLIGRKGTINNPLYIEERFWNVDTAFGLHALEDLDSKFLYYFCLSYDFTERDKGSGRPSLVKKDLLTMNMPIPPLDIQKDIVVELDSLLGSIDQLKESYKSKLSELEDLKQSILQKAFAGELLKDSPK